MKVSVKLDVQSAMRSLSGMQNEVRKGAARALRRVGTTVRKEADQEIRQRLALKSAIVKDSMRLVVPFTSRVLVVDIIASGKPIPLREFQARETRKGVTFAVKRGAARRVYRRKGSAGFLIDRFGRHVYVRVSEDPPGPGKARIAKVYGPSIPQYFVTRAIREAMRRVTYERWPIEFSRELAFRRSRSG